MDNNRVILKGISDASFGFSHETGGRTFYKTTVLVRRLSGYQDRIPVIVPGDVADITKDWAGKNILIIGEFRSYSLVQDGGNKVDLFVFARKWRSQEPGQGEGHVNEIRMNGYLCKEPIYRRTPLGREITEFILAVNYPYGKSSYIPCICWGWGAQYAAGLKIGSQLSVSGRIQSRIYTKKVSDGIEERVAYEVSVSEMGYFG